MISSRRQPPNNCGSGLVQLLRSSVESRAAAVPAPGPEVAVDAERKLESGKGKPKKQRIIVIGAGISGLRAASVLQRHDVEVVLLEARDRIGGRICTTRNDEQTVKDLGRCALRTHDGVLTAGLPPANGYA